MTTRERTETPASHVARPAKPGPAGVGLVDRFARRLVTSAARRWPGDLSEIMADEWQAELDALRAEPELRPSVRAWRTLTFAGSLAVWPPVEAEGEEPVSTLDRWGRSLAAAAGVTLLAAALFNGVHAAQDRFGDWLPPGVEGAAALALLAIAAVLMAAIGARSQAHAGRRCLALGAGLFAFLLAGNQVAVMPFMGWTDIAPAVVVWTVLSAATAHAVSRLGASRPRRALALGAAGGLITLELATIAGSMHAAAKLGVGLASAPGWFPLAMLPGGTATFGTYFADGSAAFGSLRASGPAFHASDILIGNAATMAGPMLLCSAFVLALALRTASPSQPTAPHQPVAPNRVTHRSQPTSPDQPTGPSQVTHRSQPTGPSRVTHRNRAARPGQPTGPSRATGRSRAAGLGRSVRHRVAGSALWAAGRQVGAVLRRVVRIDLRIPFGVGAALGGLAGCELLRRADAGPSAATLHRLVDNSNVFGFGFVAHTPGRVAVALIVGLLAAHLGDALRTRRD